MPRNSRPGSRSRQPNRANSGAICGRSTQFGGALLFHLLFKLYKRTSAVITTNLSFGEWASVFDDVKMTTALPDRLTHRCHILKTGNDSFRFKNSSASLNLKRKTSSTYPHREAFRPTKRVGQYSMETWGQRDQRNSTNNSNPANSHHATKHVARRKKRVSKNQAHTD
jgi:hypothetical protein